MEAKTRLRLMLIFGTCTILLGLALLVLAQADLRPAPKEVERRLSVRAVIPGANADKP